MAESPSLQQIQQVLGPAWTALLHQQYLIGGQQLAMGLVLLVLAFILVRASHAIEDGEEAIVWKGLLWAGAVVCLLPACGFVLDGFGHFLNPDGYAVQGVIDGLGGRHGG